MSQPGEADEFMVLVRATLLDALEALSSQRESVVVIGAQAIYLHTGAASVAIAEYTKDSDLALDPRALTSDPLIEAAMEASGFTRAPDAQPGAWLSVRGVPVDLMVPEALAGHGSPGTRGARIPPHSRRATRRAVGLEAAMVDAGLTPVSALDPSDTRSFVVRVAGPAALLVAKLHKIAERIETPHRLVDKDAHDVYRLLRAVPTGALSQAILGLLADPLSRQVTEEALIHLDELFAGGAESSGAVMAGRAEAGVGDPAQVAVAVSLLAADLLGSLPDRPTSRESTR
jgi:hypothetical protein